MEKRPTFFNDMKGEFPQIEFKGLPFEAEGYRVNRSGDWRRLYGQAWGYHRDFGWRSSFRGTEGGRD